MKRSVKYGRSLIEYDLAFSDRKTLGIKVHPDKSVQVIAPTDSPIEKINEKIRTKASWILKQQAFFLSFYPLTPPRKYISGETHLYLGKQYRLKLIQSAKESVKLYSGYITVSCADPSNRKRVKALLDKWYSDKAKIHFQSLFDHWISAITPPSKEPATLIYKWMSDKWGRCNNQNQITLNIKLIQAPKKCIEYVIVHEICHLTHLNHSKSFYQLLELHYPGWRRTKHQLETFMA